MDIYIYGKHSKRIRFVKYHHLWDCDGVIAETYDLKLERLDLS